MRLPSLPASCSSSRSFPSALIDNVTACTSNPMIATTTRSSRSVKPRCGRDQRSRSEIPVTDVGIDTFTAFLAVGAVREDVELTALARVCILVRLFPRIYGSLRQLLPPIRCARLAGVRYERLEPFCGARVAEIVEPVKLKSCFDATNVGPCAIDSGGVDLAHEVRC